jgi:hypothetical protein
MLGTCPSSSAHFWIAAIISSLLTAFSCQKARFKSLWSAAALGCGIRATLPPWVQEMQVAETQGPKAKGQRLKRYVLVSVCREVEKAKERMLAGYFAAALMVRTLFS